MHACIHGSIVMCALCRSLCLSSTLLTPCMPVKDVSPKNKPFATYASIYLYFRMLLHRLMTFWAIQCITSSVDAQTL